ncbi:MAG: flagellar motor switch phosphatase FliY, partial [Bacillota bacterium]
MEELSALEKDTIAEVGNISLGASATALSTILNKSVDITTPKLEVLSLDQVQRAYPVPCIAVKVEYTAGLQGSNMLLIKEADALIIAALMMGEPYENKAGPLTEIELSAVQEAMNQMMGSMTTSMSELFQRPIDISPPGITMINLAEEKEPLEEISEIDQVVQVEFSIKVDNIIDSAMIQVIPVEFARQMAADLLSGEPGAAPDPEEETSGSEATPGEEETGDGRIDQPVEDKAVVEAVINTGGTEEAVLSDLEKDTIAEVGNISLGASATALSTILDKLVDITTPTLNIMKVENIQEKYPLPCVLVEVDYTSGLEGRNILLIKQEDAVVIASIMMGEPYEGKEGPLNEIE